MEKYGFEVRQKHVHKPGSKPKVKAHQEAPEFVDVKIEVDKPTEEEPSSSFNFAEESLKTPSVSIHGDNIEEPMDLDEFNENLSDEEDHEEEANEERVVLLSNASSSEEDEKEESDDDDNYNPINKTTSFEG